MKYRPSKKGMLKLTIGLFLAGILSVFGANFIIDSYGEGKTFDSVTKIKHNKVGLVLGTSKLLKNGYVNLYFKYRIAATVALYKNKKIDFVLVSGDNSSKSYDEPTDFKNELIKKGIPANKIFLDFAGFRTLDSVVRAKKIFGQSSLTFISQEFHNERAIFIARMNGINAVGFNAKNVSKRYGIRVQAREYLARVKVFLDIIIGKGPKYLGKEITIK